MNALHILELPSLASVLPQHIRTCLWLGVDSFGPPTLPLLVTGNSISRRKGTKLVYVWLCITVCMGSRAVSLLVEVQ